MKIYGIPRINAMGLKGPEEVPKRLSKEFKIRIVDIDNDNIEKSEEEVYKKAKEIFEEKRNVAFIGGDHSITYPIFKAFSKKKTNPFLIVFDAHADCMQPLKEPTHEEFLRGIIERGLNPEKVILIGARKIEPEEKEFLNEKKITFFKDTKDIEEIKKTIKEKTKGHEVYLSIDIDVLDPKISPAVNYPESRGISKEDLLEIIEFIKDLERLQTVDIVEFVPAKDQDNKTEEIIKDIIKKIKKI